MKQNKNLIHYIFSSFIIVVFLAGCSTVQDKEVSVEKDVEISNEKVSETSSQQESSEIENAENTEDIEDIEVTENTDDAESADKTETASSDEAVSNDKVIEISAFEMGFNPEKITLTKGTEYEFILINEGKVFHDLNAYDMDIEITYMDEMDAHPDEVSFIDKIFGVKVVSADVEKEAIHMNVDVEQSSRIKFIPLKEGEYKIYCSVPGHEQAGMVGTIIVVK
ncbi:plastocyanin/azurin family copper-binding protein [Cytobacillus sp. IB215665]|uniref:plastocyanin/azurin family copper-binding protein n=1 Tax=Cytobacillus sp. IB215665 TaxID=3097357 RepID=UPI002A0EBA10|nr:plastocyanin/azurin family copper-binding protein [Cytobacillus sp. IB215665]MDX8366707.1 cupredoxin domain-containing protein [Cytobacillus sp. IB215665]